jgi:PAS domain S-box-containing protein
MRPTGAQARAIRRISRVSRAALRRRCAFEESLLRAQDELGVGAAIIDGPSRRFLLANDAMARIFGLTRDELMALPSYLDLFEPAEQELLIAAASSRAAGAPTDFREISARRKDGAHVEIEIGVKSFATGLPRQYIAVVRDVTERRAMHARVMLADRLATLGTLTAGIAHEINNPLAYVMVNLEFAIAHPDRQPQLEQALREARDGAARIRRIVMDMGLLTRNDRDIVGPVDVASVLDSALNIASASIRPHGRVVREVLDVPKVRASEGQLGQVFLNLLINAAHSLPNARGERLIHVRTLPEPGDPTELVRVEFADSGRGIPADLRERIFEPFVTTKATGEGTGLGLFLCRNIVSSFGGSIEVESTEGEGSVFRVRLPVDR